MIETVVGSAGLFLLLLAFFLNHFKKFRRATYKYNALNFLGAIMLTYYAFVMNNLVFILLEAVWVFVAAYFLLKRVKAYD